MFTVIWHGQGAIRIAIFDDKISIPLDLKYKMLRYWLA
jgi:hypothetical protein